MAVKKSLRFQVLRRDNHACRYCGQTAPDVKLHVDHVVPAALGGSDDPENLVTACSDCNSGKAATPPDAETVGDISQENLRWEAAMKRAASIIRDRDAAEQKRQDDILDQFKGYWNEFRTRDGERVPLPAGWKQAVIRFADSGVLLGPCVDITMAASEKVSIDDRFKYMCGVARNKVKEIEKIAREILEEGAA